MLALVLGEDGAIGGDEPGFQVFEEIGASR
jgi:hypothetical protein